MFIRIVFPEWGDFHENLAKCQLLIVFFCIFNYFESDFEYRKKNSLIVLWGVLEPF